MKKWTPYLLIILAVFVTYFRSLFFGFTYLDDNVLVLDSLNFLKNFANVFTAFGRQVFFSFGSAAFYYRPLLTVSFIFDAQLSGSSPFFYHLTNISLHLVTSCLVFLLLKKLNYKEILALFFALVFAVHPVLTQAVSWIPGRNDSLLAVFVLASFLAFLDNKFYLHLFFFALAIFIKETALLFPVILTAYHFLISKNNKLSVGGWTAILIFWFILRQAVLGGSGGYGLEMIFSSLVNNFPATLLYLGKIFFPFNLSILPVLRDSTLIPGLVSLVILALLVFWLKERRSNYIIFGVIWFLIFLVPSFIRPNTGEMPFFIEHRVYLPIIGLFIILLETKIINFSRYLGMGIIVLFSVLTIIHSGNFSDRISFWTNAVTTSPHSPLAHRNLGAMYYLDNKYDLAEGEFLKALELNKNEPMVHNNLGLIYMNRGEYQNSEEEFKKELALYPNYDNGYFNLGILYYKIGKQDLAISMWKKTIKLNPNYEAAYHYLNQLKLR